MSLAPNRDERTASVNLRGQSALVLANEPLIQSDLQLTAEQARALRQLASEFLAGLAPILDTARRLKDLDAGAQVATSTQMQLEQRALVASFDEAALQLLTAIQQRRLGEVVLQLKIEEAMLEPDVLAALRLSSMQRSKLERLRSELRVAATALHDRHRRSEIKRAQLQAELAALRTACLARHQALLTSPQTAALRQMLGRPIEFSPNQLRLELGAVPLARAN